MANIDRKFKKYLQMKRPNCIIVPGWQDSLREHWQNLWLEKFGFIKVYQDEWLYPKKDDWVNRLVEVIHDEDIPPILITHSLGCNTALWALKEHKIAIAGLFMVAMPDLELATTPEEIQGFHPTPMDKLTIPTTLVMSSNDQYCKIERAQEFATKLNAELVDVDELGHINQDSKIGEWEAGQALFSTFLDKAL